MTTRQRPRNRANDCISFRVMMEADLPQVFTIEAESFRQPWSEADFYDVMDDPDTVALVAECQTKVVGYILTSWKYGWVRILSCTVKPAYRRRGIGTRMIAPLVEGQKCGRYEGVYVKVPERKLSVQQFFRSCGFRAVRILRGCLFDDRDVYVMQCSQAAPPEEVESGTWSEDELVPCWEAKHA